MVNQHLVKLPKTLNAWHTDNFTNTFKNEISSLKTLAQLLQQGLSHTSYAKTDRLEIIILNKLETPKFIEIKTSIFYFGIIAGCNCDDDPTPINELTEHCEILFKITKSSAETEITLLTT